jgi:hypothetical protein
MLTIGSRHRVRLPAKGANFSALLILLAAPPDSTQRFSIDWFSVQGGGTSLIEGGSYAISGTVGRPGGEGALSGGDYDLFGGFWSTQFEPLADLLVTQSDVPDPVTGLDPLVYSISVTNRGPNPAPQGEIANDWRLEAASGSVTVELGSASMKA